MRCDKNTHCLWYPNSSEKSCGMNHTKNHLLSSIINNWTSQAYITSIKTLNNCWLNVGPTSATLAQLQSSRVWTCYVLAGICAVQLYNQSFHHGKQYDTIETHTFFTFSNVVVEWRPNPLTTGATYARVFVFYYHIRYHILNMLKITCDINQQDLKRVDLQFVKSE